MGRILAYGFFKIPIGKYKLILAILPYNHYFSDFEKDNIFLIINKGASGNLKTNPKKI